MSVLDCAVLGLTATCENCQWYRDTGVSLDYVKGWCEKDKMFIGRLEKLDTDSCFEEDRVKAAELYEYMMEKVKK